MPYFFLIAATLNVLVLTCVLAAALFVQFAMGELPCPLCVMQRIALMACAIGPLFLLAQNRRGAITHRDLATAGGMAVLAALLGAWISGRQVLLHILPGDPGYGGTVLGLHLYTICLLVFVCQALAAAIMLMCTATSNIPKQVNWPVAKGVFLVFGLTVAISFVAIILQAGWHWLLPPDPVSYLLLSK